MPLELLQDTDLSLSTIAHYQSSHYPDYLSPTWDKDTQRAVVWTRLWEHCKLANHSLAKVNEHFLALCQEQQSTQAESSHEPLSCDNFAGKAAALFTKRPGESESSGLEDNIVGASTHSSMYNDNNDDCDATEGHFDSEGHLKMDISEAEVQDKRWKDGEAEDKKVCTQFSIINLGQQNWLV